MVRRYRGLQMRLWHLVVGRYRELLMNSCLLVVVGRYRGHFSEMPRYGHPIDSVVGRYREHFPDL